MTSSSLLLARFALALLLLSCAGSWMWTQWVVTGKRLVQREAVAVAAINTVGHESAIDVNLRRSRLVQAHAHALNLCILLITGALLLQQSRFSEVGRRRIAFTLMVGVMVYPIALVIDANSTGVVSHGLALLGAGLVIVGFIALAIDRWRPLEMSNG
jgi:hypothetical protein